jgi:hypothetical protein
MKTVKQRFQSIGSKQGPYPKEKACRIWPEIAGTRCRIWLGTCIRGYGRFWDGTYTRNGNQRLIKAHCFSYELAYGEGSLGKKKCCHKCDRKKCIHPLHLFKGTHRANMHDMKVKDRQAKGEKQGSAKLTAVQVSQIRSSKGSCRQLGREFGVDKKTINRILNRKTWRHVK